MVVEEITGFPFEKVSTSIGKLMINHFSFVFSIKVNTPNGSQSVFVKIPKKDLRKGSPSIYPISLAERKMAEDEASSLRTLSDQWHSDDLCIFWARLRGVFPNYNAIVTDAIVGDDAFSVLRQLDLRHRLGSKRDHIRLCKIMARLGKALGRFHDDHARPAVFRVNEIQPKIEHYCKEIGASVKGPWPNKIIQSLNLVEGLELGTFEVPTLKGIDIRNILMDEQDNLFLIDPGRMKLAYREADLARFIMTYRIIYWGSILFFLRIKPDLKAENAFFDAYYSRTSHHSQKLLSLFLVKEQLKHWHTALDSLRLFMWPNIIKRFIAVTYINPFYTQQLAVELKRVI